MTHHDQADTLSLDTSVLVSGSGGSSTPEGTAGNCSYAAWSWEAILATVLDIPISDRSEVTGQPWLIVVQRDQPDPAAHQIWSASWKTKRKGGARSSLRVCLSPELYVGGGAWDRFSNAPARALSGSAPSLPLVAQSFQAAQQALASVTAGFHDLSEALHSAHHDLRTESNPFQGNAADFIAELVSDLHGATLSIYDQLSNPSYSNAVGAAGDAATTFLSAINSAYGAWNALPEHSPLGAVVHVLTDIATPDGSGGYTIPDPEDTPFGDLTTSGAWAAVERQAKNIWMGPLTGSSSDFGGLDQLGRSALSGLVDQYNTTAGVVTPVVGPAPPSTVQTPVGGPNGFGKGGGPQGGPNSGNPPRADFRTGEDESARLEDPGPDGVLSGAIGATPEPTGQTAGSRAAPAGRHGETHGGFGGTVGRGHETKGTALRHPDRGPNTDVDQTAGTGAGHKRAEALTAPAAGFSVGGGPHGSLLSRSAVPSVADKPPSVTSSQVNLQLTPGGPGSPVSTAAMAGPQGGGPGAGSLAGPVGSPLAGEGAQAGSPGPMMMPLRPGTGGAGLGGQHDERRAYLPEDEGYWGTGPDLPGPADRPVADEPDFDGPRVIVGIGAEADPRVGEETMSNWRMR